MCCFQKWKYLAVFAFAATLPNHNHASRALIATVKQADMLRIEKPHSPKMTPAIAGPTDEAIDDVALYRPILSPGACRARATDIAIVPTANSGHTNWIRANVTRMAKPAKLA